MIGTQVLPEDPMVSPRTDATAIVYELTPSRRTTLKLPVVAADTFTVAVVALVTVIGNTLPLMVNDMTSTKVKLVPMRFHWMVAFSGRSTTLVPSLASDTPFNVVSSTTVADNVEAAK